MDATIRHVLEAYDTWAVVGLSPSPLRDSHHVAELLQRLGKRVVPVNPMCSEVLGERAYPDLRAAAAAVGPIEVVDVFRRSELAGAHVDEAIDIGARAVWLQLGVIDEAAAQRARDRGLEVVMDRCPAIEWPKLTRAS
jgi:uncharacterized protein